VTREKAIQAMDLLNQRGYSATLHASVHPNYSPERTYSIGVAEIGIDKVDVRALLELADELDLDLGFSPVRGMGTFTLGEPDRRPEVVRTQRKHPR
jgi:hypothetical protein